jgi:hypothetical protein
MLSARHCNGSDAKDSENPVLSWIVQSWSQWFHHEIDLPVSHVAVMVGDDDPQSGHAFSFRRFEY